MKAIWHNSVLAESSETIIIEDNHYFPMSSLNMQFFIASEITSHCPWKGDASYYSVTVNAKENKDCAWYYQEPKKAAQEIKNHVAFWRGVEVIE